VYLAENVRLEEALARLQNAGQRLAIVLDLDRREVGILTLGDILKRLFGEVTL
jgi:CBS domain containing-hemolysin-like protein